MPTITSIDKLLTQAVESKAMAQIPRSIHPVSIMRPGF